MNTKNKEKKQFWVILFIVFLGFLGISMPYLIFPSLFLNPERSILPIEWSSSTRALFLGLTLAAYPFGQFIGSPILGSLSDDYGRKKLLSWSLLLAAICNLFAGFAITFYSLSLLIISRFFTGFMEGNVAIARAMAADMTTLSKHKTFGKINAATSMAFLIGPLLGGLLTDTSLSEYLVTSTPFYMTCILFIALTCLSVLVLEESASLSSISEKHFWERMQLIKRIGLLFKNKRLKFLMIVSTCFTLAVDIFYEFGPVYLTVKWSLEPSQLVLYNGVLCLALAVGNGWLSSFILSFISTRSAIIYSLGGLALFLIGIIMTNSSLSMIILFILSGCVIGSGVTLLTVKISNTVAENIQGEVMGTQLSLRVLGDAFICVFGGLLLILSPKIILIVAAMISFFATIYYITQRQKILSN